MVGEGRKQEGNGDEDIIVIRICLYVLMFTLLIMVSWVFEVWGTGVLLWKGEGN